MGLHVKAEAKQTEARGWCTRHPLSSCSAEDSSRSLIGSIHTSTLAWSWLTTLHADFVLPEFFIYRLIIIHKDGVHVCVRTQRSRDGADERLNLPGWPETTSMSASPGRCADANSNLKWQLCYNVRAKTWWMVSESFQFTSIGKTFRLLPVCSDKRPNETPESRLHGKDSHQGFQLGPFVDQYKRKRNF